MPVNFWPLIKINNYYITSTGLVGGVPYMADLAEGIDELALDSRIQVTKALSGKPYLNIVEGNLGAEIVIKPDEGGILAADHAAIVAIVQAFITSATAINLSFSGAAYPSKTNLSVVPAEKPIRYPGKFANGRLLGSSYHFLVA